MLKIKNLTLSSDAVSAPLAGLSDLGFRHVALNYGAGLVYTEMISVKGLLYGNKETENMLKFPSQDTPTAVQLFGNEPKLFYEVLKNPLLDNFAVIDINMGCPVPKVVKNGEGSALMNEPNLAKEIVSATVEGAGERGVTVKIRSGWEEVTAPEFAQKMEEAGASAITVHGRLRKDFYAGQADYSVIKAVKEAVSIPVIGNGDVRSKQDYDRIKEETLCDGVMIGRGAVGNQKIFAEIKGLDILVDRGRDIRNHFSLLLNRYPEKVVINLMKAHLMYYVKGIKGATDLRRAIAFLSTEEEIYSIIDRIDKESL